MFLIGFPLVLLLLSYFILIRNLAVSKRVKSAIMFFLFLASFKNQILLLVGGDILAPQLPRNVLIFFSAIQVVLILTIVFSLFLWGYYILKSIFKLNFCGKFPRFSIKQEITIFVLAVITASYATYEALESPKIEHYTFYDKSYPKLSNTTKKPFRIVQITDTHFGANASVEQAKNFVQLINSQNPDVVLITGDLIDGAPEISAKQLDEFLNIKAPYGIYAVNGNHEYYSDIKLWAPVWENYGIKMLNNEHEVLSFNGYDAVVIAGVTDTSALKHEEEGPDIKKALENVDKNLPVVLMSHRPSPFIEYADEADFDLMLSGHTHGGMMIGLKQLVAFFNKGFVSGLYTYKNSKLIVSNGTFTWGGFCARILTPSEIIVIDLVKKD